MLEQSPETHEDVLRTVATTTDEKPRDKKPTTVNEREEDPWIGKSTEPEKPQRQVT